MQDRTPRRRLAAGLPRARGSACCDAVLPPAEREPARLHAAKRYAALGEGKRIRPLLVYATGSAIGVAPASARRAGGGGRADPRLLARARRPARHGRRRPAPRPADHSSRVRRGDGDPRGRRAAGARLRAARERADAGRRRRGPRRDDPPARAGERHGRHGRRPGDGPRGDRPAPRAAADRGHARAQDRRADPRLGAHRLRGEPAAARRDSATRSTATAARSASASRSWTTCSTCSAIPP